MPSIERSIHDVYPFISPTHALSAAATGKTLLITGAGTGVGRAIAQTFAAAGASRIIICGRTRSTLDETKALVEAASPACSVHPLVVDVTDTGSVGALFAQAPFVADILVNNAGICHSPVYVGESEPEVWWRDMEVNVKGVYLCTRAYLKALDGGKGTIINISSSVSDAPAVNMSSYSTAKLAVNRFTEIVQMEYGKQGVNAYALHPGGIVATEMGKNAPPQYADWMCDTAELAAGTALYMSTPRAEYLKGRFVYSSWDMEKVEALKREIVEKNMLVHKLDMGEHMGKAIVLDDGRRKEY